METNGADTNGMKKSDLVALYSRDCKNLREELKKVRLVAETAHLEVRGLQRENAELRDSLEAIRLERDAIVRAQVALSEATRSMCRREALREEIRYEPVDCGHAACDFEDPVMGMGG